MVIDDTGSVEGIYAFKYCTKWGSGQVLPMPYGLTQAQTLKNRATQLLIKYKSGALVTQCIGDCSKPNLVRRRVWSRSVGVHCVHLEIDVFNLATSINCLTLINLHFFLLSLLIDS